MNTCPFCILSSCHKRQTAHLMEKKHADVFEVRIVCGSCGTKGPVVFSRSPMEHNPVNVYFDTNKRWFSLVSVLVKIYD